MTATTTGMLDGKVALITGGARGIGRETAALMSREGARVVVADLNADGLGETVAAINAGGGQATSVVCDVTRVADVERMVQATVSAYGRIDCAFNNAGIAPYQLGAGGQALHEWSETAFDRMLEVNGKGVWLCMRAQVVQMLKQGAGSIVNTASLAGLVGLRTASAYVAAKHAVVGLTKTAALEYAPTIRVNCVCPGFIETEMTKDTMARRGPEIMAAVPFHRMGTAREVAELVCWLASDRASFATGGAYPIDGGHLAQ
jgi:NAD(P)-dependent dehydrogenase (short-subunit alcohol dehydrogenase family)